MDYTDMLSSSNRLDRHLSDGRQWVLGGNEPTFADITLCTAIVSSCLFPRSLSHAEPALR